MKYYYYYKYYYYVLYGTLKAIRCVRALHRFFALHHIIHFCRTIAVQFFIVIMRMPVAILLLLKHGSRWRTIHITWAVRRTVVVRDTITIIFIVLS